MGNEKMKHVAWVAVAVVTFVLGVLVGQTGQYMGFENGRLACPEAKVQSPPTTPQATMVPSPPKATPPKAASRTSQSRTKSPKRSTSAAQWKTPVSSRRGVLYVLGTKSPEISFYKERYKSPSYGSRNEAYARECQVSLNTLRATNRRVKAALVTDAGDEFDWLKKQFDVVIHSNSLGKTEWGDKIPAMMLTPFKHTLYLDADTVVCRDVGLIFNYAKTYDLSMGLEPRLIHKENGKDFTGTFSEQSRVNEYNSGLMVYRRTQPMWNLLQAWHAVKRTKVGGDQWHLQILLSQNRVPNLNFGLLPNTFNLRINSKFLPRSLLGEVFVLHARHSHEHLRARNMTNLGLSCAVINRSLEPRVFGLLHGSGTHRVEYLAKLIREDGKRKQQKKL